MPHVMHENPEWKPALVTGVFGFLGRAPGIAHCSLVDLSNCKQQTHLMLSQETLWDILENAPDPTQSLALNSLLGMKAQSWPVPSVFLHAVSKVCSWQLSWLQNTGFTAGTFCRYCCIISGTFSFCSMQGSDPMRSVWFFKELNAEIILMTISFNITSAFEKGVVELLSWIPSWPCCCAEWAMSG